MRPLSALTLNSCSSLFLFFKAAEESSDKAAQSQGFGKTLKTAKGIGLNTVECFMCHRKGRVQKKSVSRTMILNVLY